MSPKSLLRHPLAVSRAADFTETGFQAVIDEIDEIKPAKEVERVILCSGKIYCELLERRRSQKIDTIALIRVEQLFSFPDAEIERILQQYGSARSCIWCQEEPRNQGAWLNIQPWIQVSLAANGASMALDVASRPPMAAPAEGRHKLHKKAQEAVILSALVLSTV